jgi:hypothetical protein
MPDPILTDGFDRKFVTGHPVASVADVGKGYSLVTIKGSLDLCEKVLATFELRK